MTLFSDVLADDVTVEASSSGFEGAFTELSAIAEAIEKGGMSFEESIAKYEEGMKLVQQCNDLLDNAELQITNIRETYSPPEQQRRGRK